MCIEAAGSRSMHGKREPAPTSRLRHPSVMAFVSQTFAAQLRFALSPSYATLQALAKCTQNTPNGPIVTQGNTYPTPGSPTSIRLVHGCVWYRITHSRQMWAPCPFSRHLWVLFCIMAAPYFLAILFDARRFNLTKTERSSCRPPTGGVK